MQSPAEGNPSTKSHFAAIYCAVFKRQCGAYWLWYAKFQTKEADTALFICNVGSALEEELVQSPYVVCCVYGVLACDHADRFEESVCKEGRTLLLSLYSTGNSKKMGNALRCNRTTAVALWDSSVKLGTAVLEEPGLDSSLLTRENNEYFEYFGTILKCCLYTWAFKYTCQATMYKWV